MLRFGLASLFVEERPEQMESKPEAGVRCRERVAERFRRGRHSGTSRALGTTKKNPQNTTTAPPSPPEQYRSPTCVRTST